jgi:hypothetical protein
LSISSAFPFKFVVFSRGGWVVVASLSVVVEVAVAAAAAEVEVEVEEVVVEVVNARAGT